MLSKVVLCFHSPATFTHHCIIASDLPSPLAWLAVIEKFSTIHNVILRFFCIFLFIVSSSVPCSGMPHHILLFTNIYLSSSGLISLLWNVLHRHNPWYGTSHCHWWDMKHHLRRFRNACYIFSRQYVCRFCNELEMNDYDDDGATRRLLILLVRNMVDVDSTPPPPAPVPHRKSSSFAPDAGSSPDVQITLKDIRTTLQKTQKLPPTHETSGLSDKPASPEPASPVWIPR